MKPPSVEDFRRCLIAGDHQRLVRLHAMAMPDAPRPSNPHEAELMLHLARSAARSMPVPLRMLSRQWLARHGYPAGV